jgi:hypothetical protein
VGEMTQDLYAHMNNKRKKKKPCSTGRIKNNENSKE